MTSRTFAGTRWPRWPRRLRPCHLTSLRARAKSVHLSALSRPDIVWERDLGPLAVVERSRKHGREGLRLLPSGGEKMSTKVDQRQCGGVLSLEALRLIAIKTPDVCVICQAKPVTHVHQEGCARWNVHTGFKEYTHYTSPQVSFRVPYCVAHSRWIRGKYLLWFLGVASAFSRFPDRDSRRNRRLESVCDNCHRCRVVRGSSAWNLIPWVCSCDEVDLRSRSNRVAVPRAFWRPMDNGSHRHRPRTWKDRTQVHLPQCQICDGVRRSQSLDLR